MGRVTYLSVEEDPQSQLFEDRPVDDQVAQTLSQAVAARSTQQLQAYFASFPLSFRPGYLRHYMEKFFDTLTAETTTFLLNFEPLLLSDQVADLLINSNLVGPIGVFVARGWRLNPQLEEMVRACIHDGLESCDPGDTPKAQAHAAAVLFLLESLPR